MQDRIKDDSISPDVSRPRFLLQRYDSVSGCSESSSTSSSSRGSFLQSPGRPHDQNGRRTRTNTFNGHLPKRSSEDSTSKTKPMKGRERSNGIKSDGLQDDVDNCIFCDTLVNERQYYLWNSQYTKSSLCSRCSYENDGMRYISYWGTPSYQSGSWRKRYNAGRGIDIDLTPLLEVLERIDQIDTSISGRKYQASDKSNNSSEKDLDLDNADRKESYKMAERRRRRKTNRSVIEDTNDFNNNIKTNENINDSFDDSLSKRNKEQNERTDAHLSIKGATQEFHVSEICTDIEDVDVIEPLHVINITEPSPSESYLHHESIEEGIGNENLKISHKRNGSLSPNSIGDTLSPQTLLEYRQQRRKSNYEEFLAGLEPLSQLKRRSTAAEDLKFHKRNTQNKNNTTEIKTKYDKNDKNDTKPVIENNSKNVQGKTKQNEPVVTGQNDIFKPEELDPITGKFTDRKSKEKVKHFRPKYKLKRRNTPYMEGNNIFLSKPEGSHEEKKNILQEFERNSCNQACEMKIIQDTYKMTDSSSDYEETFADIKTRFEKLSNGTKLQQTQTRFLPDKISKGHFRSRYMGSAVVASKCSDTDDEYIESGNGKDSSNRNDDSLHQRETPSNAHYMKKSEYDQSSESDSEKFEYDFTNNSNTSDDNCDMNDHQNKKNDNSSCLKIGKERLNLPCNTKNIKSNETLKKKENIDKQQDYFPSDAVDVQTPCTKHFTNVTAVTEKKNQNAESKENVPTEINSEILTCNGCFSERIEKRLEDQNHEENHTNCNKDSDEDRFMSSTNSLRDDRSFTKNVTDSIHINRSSAAKERERKYRTSESEKDENPHIARIKKKLSRKPKYENDNAPPPDEIDDVITELNGSDDEEIELGWRSRGYNTDFYMSRRSITGGEIIDRYKRAISNRRSKNNSRNASRRQSKGQNVSSTFNDIMTASDSVHGSGLKTSNLPSSAPLTRTNTQKEIHLSGNVHGHRSEYINNGSGCTGVSALALQAALNRAANCSKRMSQRLKTQLSQQSDSYDSSS